MITIRTVKTSKRLDTYKKHFDNNVKYFMLFEDTVFSVAEELSKDYDGGYWEFIELSNDGFFMYPDYTEKMNIGPLDNYYSGVVNPSSFGIIASLYAYNKLTFSSNHQSNFFAKMYSKLYEYITHTTEYAKILSAIN